MSFCAWCLVVLWKQMYVIGCLKQKSTWFKVNKMPLEAKNTKVYIPCRICTTPLDAFPYNKAVGWVWTASNVNKIARTVSQTHIKHKMLLAMIFLKICCKMLNILKTKLLVQPPHQGEAWGRVLFQTVVSGTFIQCLLNFVPALQLGVSTVHVFLIWMNTLRKEATIHQVITMLAASKKVLFPGHNHLLTTGTDDPSLACAQVIIKVSAHQYRWLAGGYDLEIGHF